MRSRLLCSLLLLCIINFCKAQDSTIVLDTSMFDLNFQTIALTGLNGWIFKEGDDTGWAKDDIETKGWIKFNPTDLTVKNADKNGRVEGWFRLKFRLDSSFRNFPIGVFSGRFAASDVYIDGQHAASFGNTGLDGKPYQEFLSLAEPPAPVNLHLQVNNDYILALHLVDYRSPFNSWHLKTQDSGDPRGYGALIQFVGPNSHSNWVFFLKKYEVYCTFWACVCGILAILFWLLYFQNSGEKNLIIIALGTTLFSAVAFFLKIDQPTGIPSSAHEIYWYTSRFLLGLGFTATILTLVKIFKRKISIPIRLYCVFSSASVITDTYFFESRFAGVIYALNVCVCLYLIIASWRKLRGPQWSVVVGISLSLVFAFLFAYNLVKFKRFPFPLVYLYMTGAFLSFPLSLMVYVAGRFKEILNEVRSYVHEVLKITEEKKEILARQNEMLEKQVEERTRELKASQAQLIQSEKMASLGELTAGIAHEIQNPLNFVNNFSEVNKELIDEASQAIKTGDHTEALELMSVLHDNEEKINHHGMRADAIVKGMLQHSRKSTGQKELTDINILAGEYLQLSYHGLRAKDKEFNVIMNTDFDQSIGKINIIPQDIGRVLLNLYNNAFYAVTEKAKQQLNSYEPVVSVRTKKINDTVQLTVKDNGNGISQKVADKIFQPFFTTKPTGEGTGLGLSLSYDIIKAHGGEIKVEAKGGEGAEFTVILSTN